MFDSTRARECIRKIMGWEEHYDDQEVPAFTNQDLLISETGEYYQDKHPALRLDLIKQSLPDNRNLEDYLESVVSKSITSMLDDITELKQLKQVGKEILANDVIYNAEGWIDNGIIPESRFVGVRFIPCMVIGLKARINRIGLQTTDPQTDLKIYLYHSSKKKPLDIFLFNATEGGQFNWVEINWEMYADDADLSGGEFYVGYYQDDMAGQAINYDNLNWETGYCGTCDGGHKKNMYKKISEYVQMRSFYVPSANLSPTQDMFDPKAIIKTDEFNWGFNFNVSALCDLTNFWCDNRRTLKKALAWKVVWKVLDDMRYSQEINYIQEQIERNIIRDLEGDKDTKFINIPTKYEKALKALRFDNSSINKICLPPPIYSGVEYGTS